MKPENEHANPSAFPNQPCDITGQPCMEAQMGMSLRDYFAARAMAAIISSPAGLDAPESISSKAFIMADTMLKQRKVKTRL